MTTPTQTSQLPKGFLVNGEHGNVRPIHYEMFPKDLFFSLLAYFGEDAYFVISRVPGEKAGPPAHTHEVDQIFVCIRGELELTVGEDLVHLSPGSLVVIPAGVPHAHRNLGKDEEVHLELILPGIIPSYPIVEFVEDGSEWAGHGHHLRLAPSARLQELPGMQVPWRAGIRQSVQGDVLSFDANHTEGTAYLYVLEGEMEATIGGHGAETVEKDSLVRIPEGLEATLRTVSSEARTFMIVPGDLTVG